jgi:hypothetical protein
MTVANKLTVNDINTVIFVMLIWTILLIVAYFKYDSNRFFTAFGNIFIKFSFVKRTKKDLLVFALIPFSIGLLFLIFRLMMW